MQEQKKKLNLVADEKAKVEKKLSAVSSDLQSQEKKTRDDLQELLTLRQSLAQLSERQREVRVKTTNRKTCLPCFHPHLMTLHSRCLLAVIELI